MLALIKNLVKDSLFCISHPQIFSSTKHIFILGHMRSRSSVLSHIIGSNPEVIGYKELHLPYRNSTSLYKQRKRMIQEFQEPIKEKYLLDKLLQNHLVLTDKIIKSTDAKIIFLVREPIGTIKSIINMGYITGVAEYENPYKALEHYTTRLNGLHQYIQKYGNSAFFVDADELVTDADNILNKLTLWLKLETPLVKEYSKFKSTGKIGAGDPSDNISSGVLNKTVNNTEITLPNDIIEKGIEAYKNYNELVDKYRK